MNITLSDDGLRINRTPNLQQTRNLKTFEYDIREMVKATFRQPKEERVDFVNSRIELYTTFHKPFLEGFDNLESIARELGRNTFVYLKNTYPKYYK